MQTVKGMRDLLPAASAQFGFIAAQLKKIAHEYSLQEIYTPILEHVSLFHRSLGDHSDVVSKEMFSFEDIDGSQLCLRPEGTAGVTRAMVEHFASESAHQRFFYFGPMFRREKPQRGRYRQFFQGGVEIFGASSPFADVECIASSDAFLERCGIRANTELQINSLYDDETRCRHRQALTSYFQEHKGSLSPASQTRLEGDHPLRILDSKDPADQAVCVRAPLLQDYATAQGREWEAQVHQALSALGIKHTHNPRLVRGLDYYSQTVWEFVATNNDGAQNAVLAGGRYDGLAPLVGSQRPLPAVGWACGADRIALMREEAGLTLPAKPPSVAIITHPTGTAIESAQIAKLLRGKGIATIQTHANSTGAQKKQAKKARAQHFITVTDDSEATQKQVEQVLSML